MLLKVAIDPETGFELAEGTRGPGKAFLNDLARRSILILDSPSSARELRDALAGCGSRELQQIVEALLVARWRHEVLGAGPVALAKVATLAELTSWRGAIQLAVLADYKVDALEESDEQPDPEFASFRQAAASDAVASIDEQWHRVADRHESREKLWKEVFLPFAQRTSSVHVIERELAHVLYDDISNAHSSPGGPAWFLARLAGTRVRRVHIATSERRVLNKGYDVEKVREKIEGWAMAQLNGMRLQLDLVPGDFPHQRQLAFDGWAGFQIHAGLQTFDKPKLAESATLIARRELESRIRRELRELTGQRG